MLASVGTAAQTLAALASDPAAVASNPWLVAAGFVASGVTAVGASRMASAWDRRAEARDAARELLTNHHLAKAQAAAIRRCLESVANDIEEGDALKQLAEQAHTWWPELFQSRAEQELHAVSDAGFAAELAEHLAGDGWSSLDFDVWYRLLDEAHEQTLGGPLNPELTPVAARALADQFLEYTVDELKSDLRTDGEAFAVVCLRFHAETCVGLRRLDERIERLEELLGKVHEAVRQLPDGTRADFDGLTSALSEVLAEHLDPVHQKLDAALAHLDAGSAGPKRRRPFELARLPRSAVGLMGRDALKDELKRRLQARLPRIDVWGHPGMGKTALAAEALYELIGASQDRLSDLGFPDGLVVLDLYSLDGDLELAWNSLASAFGSSLPEQNHPRVRAEDACLGRRALIILEGAEVLKAKLPECLEVLAPESSVLVLTREKRQAKANRIQVEDKLDPIEGMALLGALCSAPEPIRRRIHELLSGHPLALTWVGVELGQEAVGPATIVAELEKHGPLQLHDGEHEHHDLAWLFARTTKTLSEPERQVLATLGALAHAPVKRAFLAHAFSPEMSGADMVANISTLVTCGLVKLVDPENESYQCHHVLAYQFVRQLTPLSKANRSRLASSCVLELEEARETMRLQRDRRDLQLSLAHAKALLDGDAADRSCGRLANDLLYDVTDAAEAFGDLSLSALAVAAIERWMDHATPSAQKEPGWLRERSACHSRMGNVLVAKGDLGGAMASFELSRDISQQLADADPSNAGWLHDLSVSHNKVGNVQMAKGDLGDAMASFELSRKIAKQLADADPSNAGWLRDLSVSHDMVGIVQMAKGDLDGAMASFELSRKIREQLADADPSNAGWLRDLSVSHNKVGDVQVAKGDLDGAMASFELSRKIAKQLADADPSNAGWLRDLSVSHDMVGNVLVVKGDLDGAMASFELSRKIREQLADADPSNAGWLRDLSVSHSKVGDVLQELGKNDLARGWFASGLAIAERLVDLDPTNVTWVGDAKRFRDRLDTL